MRLGQTSCSQLLSEQFGCNLLYYSYRESFVLWSTRSGIFLHAYSASSSRAKCSLRLQSNTVSRRRK